MTRRAEAGALATVWAVRRLLIPAALLLLVPASPALAQNQELFNDLKDDGAINPCAYSPGQLQKGLKGLPPDVKQYAPGVGDQLRRPCAQSPVAPGSPEAEQQAGTPGAPGGGPPRPDVPKPPEPNAKPRRAVDAPVPAASVGPTGPDAPGWLVALLVVIGVVALLALLANRVGGWSPEPFLRRLRAGFTDAGGRSADTVLELRERLTPGR